MKKSSLALAAAALAFAPAIAHSANYFSPSYYAPSDIYHGSGVVLFKKGAEVDETTGFRIPAITAGKGILIAATDVRYTGGDKDLAHSDGLYKTKLGTKFSFDGGLTWTELQVHDVTGTTGENNFQNMATDPAILFDENSNTIFMLGFRTNTNVALGKPGNPANRPNNTFDQLPNTKQTDLILMTSNDRGKTWTSRDLTQDVLGTINKGQTGAKYDMVLQGPGGGMSYKGNIYMPIQAWASRIATGTSSSVSTSGFIVSSDGGKTWQVSKMLIPDVQAKLNGTDITRSTSESNIFYHKGKIRLAVKNEDSNYEDEPRICYEYTQDANTGEWEWVKVKEDFLPKGIGAIEGSSHSLSEDVYLVAFSYHKHNRLDPTLMTNTGAKIQLDTGGGLGYTSISSDDNNIYVLYEGVAQDKYSQMFKAIDWKHKEYAVLNTQMRNRAIELNEIQDKFSSGGSFMSASYSSDLTEGSIVGGSNGIKGGIFIRGNKNVEEDMPTVAEYDVFDVTLLAGVERELFKGALGTMMVGYMNSAIDYANGSENDVNSFVAGYRLDYKNDYFGVRSGFNFMFSDNDLKRNKNEGLGKTARFNSQSFAISNELYKDLSLNDFGDVEVSAGMVNTFFKRDGFREVGGEGTDPNGQLGANNAILSDISLQSHELFVKAAWDSKPIALSDIASITFNSDLKYAVDVADMDKWKEDYISFTAERTYHDIGELYSGRDGGIFSAELGAQLQLLKQINLSVKGVADSRGEFVGKLEGKVSL